MDTWYCIDYEKRPFLLVCTANSLDEMNFKLNQISNRDYGIINKEGSVKDGLNLGCLFINTKEEIIKEAEDSFFCLDMDRFLTQLETCINSKPKYQ